MSGEKKAPPGDEGRGELPDRWRKLKAIVERATEENWTPERTREEIAGLPPNDERRPRAVSPAGEAAQLARELADFLDRHADHLDASVHAGIVRELAEAMTVRTDALRAAVRKARESGE